MKRGATLVVLVVGLLALEGCVPLIGVPSASLLTRELPQNSAELEWVKDPVKETETWTWALVFAVWGQRTTHESVVARLLEKHGADVLLDAELTTSNFGIPYLFFVTKTTAEGRPARYKNRGDR